MARRSLGLAAALMALAAPACAWNDLGHKVIALLAYDRLTPVAKANLNAILAADPQHRNLLDAAVWADANRDHQAWHSVYIAVRPSGPPGGIPPGENVVTAIKQAEEELRSKAGTPEEKADALCRLVHYIGDVHQPLHAVTRFTPQTPSGDRGGTLYRLRGRFRNLHDLWDSALNLSMQDDRAPQAFVSDLVEEWPAERLKAELEKKTPEDWAKESRDVAVSVAYTLPEHEGVRPLPDGRYLDAANSAARKRIALAGLRLARVLNTVLR